MFEWVVKYFFSTSIEERIKQAAMLLQMKINNHPNKEDAISDMLGIFHYNERNMQWEVARRFLILEDIIEENDEPKISNKVEPKEDINISKNDEISLGSKSNDSIVEAEDDYVFLKLPLNGEISDIY